MNNERIRNWALVAEIFSGIAVFITLVFLVVEIRGNSDLIRANAFNRSMESLIEFRLQIASNEGALRVMTEHWGIDSAELLRRQLLVVNLWSIYEKTYFSRQYGLVGPAEWERFESRICGYVEREDDLTFWNESVATFMTDEFRSYVTSRCIVDQPGS